MQKCSFSLLTDPLPGGNSWNHSRGGFLLFVLLHPLSCSFAISTCPLLTALIQETEIINEFALCLEETRNSQNDSPLRSSHSWALPGPDSSGRHHGFLPKQLAPTSCSRAFSEHSDGNVAAPCMTLLNTSSGTLPGDWKISHKTPTPVTLAKSPSLVSHSTMRSLQPSSVPFSCFNFLLPTFSTWPTILYFVFQLLSPAEGKLVGTRTLLLLITGTLVPKKRVRNLTGVQ